MLLLTATPFQLRPQEILELLRSLDDMHPGAGTLREHRENMVSSPCCSTRPMRVAASRRPGLGCPRASDRASCSPSGIREAAHAGQGAQLRAVPSPRRTGAATSSELEPLIGQVMRELDSQVRRLFREALRLYAFNCDLAEELGRLVIRHRRKTEHRLVRVGEEFHPARRCGSSIATRPDQHVLHAAPGLDVRGDGELPHFLLMRCVNEMHRQQGKVRKSSLGTALTGCYSTLLESAEGRACPVHSGPQPLGRTYLALLMGMVGAEQDPQHLKGRAVIARVIDAWHAGEKTLIFSASGTNTARTGSVRDILGERVSPASSPRVLSDAWEGKSMRALRGRLSHAGMET